MTPLASRLSRSMFFDMTSGGLSANREEAREAMSAASRSLAAVALVLHAPMHALAM